MTFAFTADQTERLKSWSNVLQLQENREWYERVKAASLAYNRILAQAGFAGGNDLNPAQLDDLFHQMRELSNNRKQSGLEQSPLHRQRFEDIQQ
jgi:hypothetical protein